MTKRPKKRTTSDARFRIKLERWLEVQALGQRDVALVAWHLGDIADSCKQVRAMLMKLPTLELGTAADLKALAHLDGEMYSHLLPHLQKSRASVTAFIKKAYDAAESRGELE